MPIGRRLAWPTVLALLLVTLVPIGTGSAAAASSGWVVNCEANVRARPTTTAARWTAIPINTAVTVSATVSGGAYATTCKGRVSGHSWFAITAIGGRSAKSLFGVSTVYAAGALFRSTSSGATATSSAFGIDVSRWNGRIDFAKVRASGRTFVLVKATEGRLYTDDAYARNRAAAMSAGLVVGAYHYAHPDLAAGDATLEADHFIAVAGLRHGMLLPVLDLESGASLGTAGLQRWVETWLTRVYPRLGVRAIIYTTPGFWQSAIGDTRWFADNGYRVLWVAHWDASTPKVPGSGWGGRSWTLWQYSECGTVPGMTSRCVDLDRFQGPGLASITY